MIANPQMRPVIAVDFDGTIVDHEFPGVGKLKDGAKEGMELLRSLGFFIIIWSCRTSKWFDNEFQIEPENRQKVFDDMQSALQEHSIPYDEIDDGTKGKPFAMFYLDDKALPFMNNWKELSWSIARAMQAISIESAAS